MKLIEKISLKNKKGITNYAFISDGNLILIEFVNDVKKGLIGYNALISPIDKLKFERKKLVMEKQQISEIAGMYVLNRNGVTYSKDKKYFALMIPMAKKNEENKSNILKKLKKLRATTLDNISDDIENYKQ